MWCKECDGQGKLILSETWVEGKTDDNEEQIVAEYECEYCGHTEEREEIPS